MAGRRRWIRAWGPVVAWAGAIFVASSVPGGAPAGAGWDKVGHGAAYAVLGALVTRGIAGGTLRTVTWPQVCLAVLVSTIYGVSDEWHQTFVARRTADAFDVAADAVGALIGAGAARAWSIYFRSRGE